MQHLHDSRQRATCEVILASAMQGLGDIVFGLQEAGKARHTRSASIGRYPEKELQQSNFRPNPTIRVDAFPPEQRACTAKPLINPLGFVDSKRVFAVADMLLGTTWGLCALLAGFTVLGGTVFYLVEAPLEDLAQHNVETADFELLSRLWKRAAATADEDVDADEWLEYAEGALASYRAQLRRAFQAGNDVGAGERKWTLLGSMVYCVTVYTTIGYGHVAPSTRLGQLLTIIYAIVGIPLCTVVLGRVGAALTRWIKTALTHMRRFVASRVKDQASMREWPLAAVCSTTKIDETFDLPNSTGLVVLGVYVLFGAMVYQCCEGWGCWESLYFVFISVSTIGFGDVAPQQSLLFLFTLMYLFFGLALAAAVMNNLAEYVNTQIGLLHQRVCVSKLAHQSTTPTIVSNNETQHSKKES